MNADADVHEALHMILNAIEQWERTFITSSRCDG